MCCYLKIHLSSLLEAAKQIKYLNAVVFIIEEYIFFIGNIRFL